MVVLYHIKNKSNKSIYVGISSDYKRRWDKHKRDLRRGNHHNIRLQRLWDKYGESVFEFKVIKTFASRDRACRAEEDYIKKYICINITKGGELGDTISNHPNKKLIIAKSIKTRREQGFNFSEAFLKQQKKQFPKEIWSIFSCKKCKKKIKGKSNFLRYHGENCGKVRSDLVKCPRCFKIGAKTGMTRWHFDNCKIKKK